VWLHLCIGGAALSCTFAPISTVARAETGQYAVGLKQVEYIESKEHRPMWLAVFYPAVRPGKDVETFRLPFVINVNVYSDATIADDVRHPLIMLSHGRRRFAGWLEHDRIRLIRPCSSNIDVERDSRFPTMPPQAIALQLSMKHESHSQTSWPPLWGPSQPSASLWSVRKTWLAATRAAMTFGVSQFNDSRY
jgi:hypothetical protein